MAGRYDLFGVFVTRPVHLGADERLTLEVADTYAALASCLDAGGTGSPPVSRVVDRCFRRSHRTVQRHLALLEALGYVFRYDAPGRPTRYQLVRLTVEQTPLPLEDNPRQLGDTPDPRQLGDTPRHGYPRQLGDANPRRAGVTSQRLTEKRQDARASKPNSETETLGAVIDEALAGDGDLEGWAEAVKANPWRRGRRPEAVEAELEGGLA